MILYSQEEVEKYTRMLARTYEFIRELQLGPSGAGQEHILRDIERTLGWNVPPPMKAKPPERPTIDQLKRRMELP